jgi:hypothetical protein
MVLAAPVPLLTPPPSSSPPKTPHLSCSVVVGLLLQSFHLNTKSGFRDNVLVLLRQVELTLLLKTRAIVVLTQDLELGPLLGELLRETELMVGPVRDRHAHAIYPPPRSSNPEITRRPWRVCSCLTASVSHRTAHLSFPHVLVPL